MQDLSAIDAATMRSQDNGLKKIPVKVVRARAETCQTYSNEGADDVLRDAASRMRTSWGTSHARTTSRSGISGASEVTSIGATDWATNDSGNLKRCWGLGEVLSHMSHGNVVEGNVSKMTTTIGVGVPSLDIALLDIRQTGEGLWSSALASKVHGGLHHVARGAAIVGAHTGAVLSDGRVTVGWVEADATSAIHRALKLGQIVRTREGLLGAGVAKLGHDLCVSVCEEETRTTEWSLLHDGGVAELLNKSLTTLDSGVGDLGGLGRTEADPATTLDAIDERDHAMNIGEVDEGVAYVAAGLEVNAKVHEVVSAEADIVEDGLERHLSSCQ